MRAERPDLMRVPDFTGAGRIRFVEKPVPEPGPGQLLIRVKGDRALRLRTASVFRRFSRYTWSRGGRNGSCGRA